MKHILHRIIVSPRAALLRGVFAVFALAGLLAFVSPVRVVINIQPLGGSADAAPAAILPSVTPPPPATEVPPEPTSTEVVPPKPTEPPTNTPEPPMPTSTEVPPASTEEPTAVSTMVPPEPSAEPPAEEEETPERDTDEVPTPQPPSATPEPPTVTSSPIATPVVPPTSTPEPTNTPEATSSPEPTSGPPMVPTSAPPAPAQAAPPAPAQRTIKRAPNSLPITADPDETLRFMTTSLPLLALAVLLFVMGGLFRHGAFRQRMEVRLGSDSALSQQVYVAELQFDAEQLRARWHAGTSIAVLVEELAQRNRGVAKVALTLAVQRALRRE